MLFTRDLELGMNAVSFLRKADKAVGIEDMIKEIGGDLYFYQQIMRKLRLAGIVASIRGPGGGYFVARQIVTAHDVMGALGRNVSSMCDLNQPVGKLKQAIFEAFSSVKV